MVTFRFVLLRTPLRSADAAELHHHYGVADVRRYLWDDHAPDLATVEELIAQSQQDEAGPGWWMGALRVEPGGPLVGSCGLREIPGHPGRVDIVYSLDPPLWGRGLVTEVARATLADGFDRCGLAAILGGADEANVRPFAVLRRLGMTSLVSW